MSVINQMLKDLEGRENRDTPAVNFAGTLGRKPAYTSSTKSYWAAAKALLLVLVLAAAGLLSWQGEAVLAKLAGRKDPVAPATATPEPNQPAAIEQSAVAMQIPVIDSTQINMVSLEAEDHVMRLIFEAGSEFKNPVEQTGYNGALIYRLRNTSLQTAAPILAQGNPYISSYSISQEGNDLIVSLQPRESVSIATDTQQRRFVISAQRPQDVQTAVTAAPAVAVAPVATPKAIVKPAAAVKPREQVAQVERGVEHESGMEIKRHTAPAVSAERYYQQGLEALKASRLESAVGDLTKAVRLNTNFHSARELLSLLLLRMGRKAEAYQELQQGIVIDPAYTAYARIYAQALVESGQLQEAVQMLSSSERYAQQDGEYLAFMAAVEQRLSRHDAAVTHYVVALKLSPQRGAWWLGMAISLEALERRQEARAAYETAVKSPELNAQVVEYARSRIASLGG
jgi:MSHA biogenesis protein MshN